jgi:F-type H+-transporting ATPase subunit epsilon
MASQILCSIVSAEEEIFNGEVEMVAATGTMGELGIMPGHTALLSGIKPGPIRLIMPGGAEEVFFASGGFIEVQPTMITILADTAIRADDIDEAKAVEAQRVAERELADQKADFDYSKVQADLQDQAAMLRTIRKVRERR